MYTSTRIDSGDVLSGANVGYEDRLEVIAGGTGFDISVDSRGELRVYNSGTVAYVTVNDGGIMYLGDSVAVDVRIRGGSAYFTDNCVVSDFEIEGGEFYADRSATFLGDVGISAVSGSMNNACLSGAVVMDAATIYGGGTDVYGTLSTYDTTVTFDEIDVTKLSIEYSDIIAGDVYVEGSATFTDATLDISRLEVDGDTTIVNTEATFDSFALKGAVTVSSASMAVGGDSYISGTLNLASSASADLANCRIDSASVGRASYLYLGNNVSAGTLSVGTSGSADIEKAFVNLATVNSGTLNVYATTVNTLNVNAGASATIYDGAVIKGMHANNGGKMFINNGVEIQHGYFNSGSEIEVKAGAVVDNVFISSGTKVNGFDIQYSSGVGSGAILHYVNYGDLLILDAAVAAYSSDAHLYAGQVASDVIVQYGGVLNASAGSLVSGAVVSRLGDIQVSAGAAATNIAVLSAGKITIHQGANGSEISVVSGGIIDNYGTVSISNNLLLSGAQVNLHNGAALNANFVDNGVIMSLEAGAAVNGITAQTAQTMTGINFSRAIVSSNGYAALGAGQAADVLTVAGNAMFVATAGANVTNAAVNGGYMYLTGNLTGASVNENGTLRVLAGGKTENVDVNAGWMFASNGATLNNTTLNNTGALHVSKGAEVNNTVINSGWMFVSSGASASNVAVAGGTLHVESRAVVSGATITSGWMFQSANATVNGFIAQEDTVHTNALMFSGAKLTSAVTGYINENESATATVLTKSATMVVNGGFASATQFNAASWLFVNAGSAKDTVITNRGTVIVQNEGKAAGTVVNSGWMFVSAGGSADNTIVNQDGAAHLFDGGVINNIAVNSGWMFVSGGTANNVVAATATVNVYGGKVNGAALEKKATLNVYNGAQADNVKINSGWMFVSSGATANTATVGSWGALHILNGGVANNAILDSGWTYVSNGATLNNASALDRSTLNVYDGATVSGIFIESGATINGFSIKNDQSAAGLSFSNAVVSCNTDKAVLYSNQSASMTTVSSGAVVRINSNAVIADTALNEAQMIVNGGYVLGVGLTKGASITADSAYIDRAQFYNGTAVLGDGTDAYNTVIHKEGAVTAKAGAELNNTVVNGGGLVLSRGTAADDLAVSAGIVSAYGIVNDAVITGGVLSAGHGATLTDTTVGKNGTLVMSGHVIHSGTLNIADGATVTAKNGAVINFTVAGRTTADTYLVNNLDAITGTVDYTITVSGNEAVGSYALAQSAASFTGSITITDNADPSTVYGTVTVNGEKLYHNGTAYSLKSSDGNLTLQVSAIEDSALSANGVSQIVGYDAARGAVGYVATDPSAAATWKGIWQWDYPEKWSVLAVGRFEGKLGNETDGILLYNEDRHTLVAWTDLSHPSYGQVELGTLDKGFSVTGLANLDGNSYDDVIVTHENGSFGVMLDGKIFKSIWNVASGSSTTLKVVGSGSFGGETDKLVVIDTATNAVSIWTNNDPSYKTWSWSSTQIATLGKGWEIVAIGDFSGDGVDDIITMNTENGYMFAWENGDSSDIRWVGAVDPDNWEIAGVGDYDGDSKDDLLLRETFTGWGGLGYWGAGYAGNWEDLNARIENNSVSNFTVIA